MIEIRRFFFYKRLVILDGISALASWVANCSHISFLKYKFDSGIRVGVYLINPSDICLFDLATIN